MVSRLALEFLVLCLCSTSAVASGGPSGWITPVWSWGNDAYGHATVPTYIPMTSIAKFASSGSHSVVLRTNGQVIAWGRNSRGECSVPANLGAAVSIAAGGGYSEYDYNGSHSAAVRSDGTVFCWGDNSWGQCAPPAIGGPCISIAAGTIRWFNSFWRLAGYTVALRADGGVVCWGYNNAGQCNTPTGLVATAIAAGGQVTAALRSDGSVVCWGSVSSPGDIGTAVEIGAGADHVIARLSDGRVVCWGSNGYGQLNVPTELTAASSVAAAGYHCLAASADGQVYCWGDNSSGQCSVPTAVLGSTHVAAGYANSFAWTTVGSALPVRAIHPDGTGYTPYPTVSAAASTPAGWMIESINAACEPLSIASHPLSIVATEVAGAVNLFDAPLSAANSLRIHGQATLTRSPISAGGDLVCEQDLVMSGATTIVQSAGTATISGAVQTDGLAVIEAQARSIDAVGVTIGSLPGTGIRIVCNGQTDILGAIDLASTEDPTIALDVDSTGPIVLRGGIGSTQPTIATHRARFRGATDGSKPHAFGLLVPATGLIDLPAGNQVLVDGPKPTRIEAPAVLRDGVRFGSESDLVLAGATRIPSGATVNLTAYGNTASPAKIELDSAGTLLLEFGGNVNASASSGMSIRGSATVDQGSLLSVLGGSQQIRITPEGEVRSLGGTVRTSELVVQGQSSETGVERGEYFGVDSLIDVLTLRIEGGSLGLYDSTVFGDLSIKASVLDPTVSGEVAFSGQIFGDLDCEAGSLLTIGDSVVIGNVVNQPSGRLAAQVGVLYITGDLQNDGLLYGNVVTSPAFQGGGTGGTQPGDGIRVAGSVHIGPHGNLRFIEELWKFSICGDFSIACTADHVRLVGTELTFEGCSRAPQVVEATSFNEGCLASVFNGTRSGISAIGEFAIAPGSTVSLTDQYDNAPGNAPEAIYTRGLHVFPGATLLTNGVKIYAMTANIEGFVDDPANICVPPETPDPDINDDGFVNGIDLAFVLTYWSSAAAFADLDRDGVVGGGDLAIILDGWTG